MLNADQRVLAATSLKNPMTSEAAIYMILKDELPSDYDFDGAIATLDLSPAECNQLSSILTVQGLPAVVQELERRLNLSFEEERTNRETVKQEIATLDQAIERWKALRPEYVLSDYNAEVLLSFLANPEDFGYYVSGDGQVRYSKDHSTPASKLAQAESNLTEVQKLRLKPLHPKLIAAQSEVNKRRSEAMASSANRSLPITVKNLETAYVALMALGRLDENIAKPVRPYFVGQTDPSKDVGIDKQIRKSPSQMSADEFVKATEDSKSFREKIKKADSQVTVLPNERKLETQRVIARLNSRQYDEKYQSDPEFRQRIDELNQSAVSHA